MDESGRDSGGLLQLLKGSFREPASASPTLSTVLARLPPKQQLRPYPEMRRPPLQGGSIGKTPFLTKLEMAFP